MRETVLKQGVVVDPAGPEGLAALLKSDFAKWQKVVAQGKIRGNSEFCRVFGNSCG